MRKLTVLGALGLVVLIAVVGYWHAVDARRYAVPLPPANASPQRVVLAYLHALDGHDTSTAEHLVTHDNGLDLPYWLSHTASLTNIRITGTWWDATYGRYAGGPYAHAWEIGTSFDYRYHWWIDSAGTNFPNGHQPYWGFTVVRDHGRWLIRDQGQA